jgi:type I restriction enzyme S subunit
MLHLYQMTENIFPPLPEQRSIARVLSDTDELINALDKLIAKKRDIKKAVMQELLTGKTRLPGFSGKWEVKKLGDLGIFLKGSGVKKNESLSGDLPCIRYGEIYTKYNYYIKEIYSYISHEVASTATKMEKNDILFAGSGETKEEIGKCVAFVHDLEAYAGGDIIILRPYKPYKIDSIFLGYYLNSAPISKQKASKGQGDAVVHISTKALSMIEVKIPSVDEQRSIAQVLSDMDREITALEQRRDKTKAIKQGMMQALLTGRIRLPKEDTNDA